MFRPTAISNRNISTDVPDNRRTVQYRPCVRVTKACSMFTVDRRYRGFPLSAQIGGYVYTLDSDGTEFWSHGKEKKQDGIVVGVQDRKSLSITNDSHSINRKRSRMTRHLHLPWLSRYRDGRCGSVMTQEYVLARTYRNYVIDKFLGVSQLTKIFPGTCLTNGWLVEKANLDIRCQKCQDDVPWNDWLENYCDNRLARIVRE